MKRIIKISGVLLAALLSVGAFAGDFELGDYELVSVPNNQIDRFLPIGTDETRTPKNLQGLWWMDGNPLADKVVSFAAVKFADVRDRHGKVVGHRTWLPVFDEGVWSWDDSRDGLLLYSLVYETKLQYRGVFNENYTFGQVTPILQPLRKKIPVPPSMAVDFTMRWRGHDEWSRDSILLGKKYTYRFRRIVDGEGNRLPAWDEFIATVVEDKGLTHSLLPRCRRQKHSGYPTECAWLRRR